MSFTTVPAAFAATVAAGADRPLITWYDDGNGERAELSAATCANWVAKTANLLVDGCGLAPGDAAAVDLPPHWQTAAVLLGCWSAGLRVTDTAEEAEVVFAAGDRVAGHLHHGAEVYGSALAPMAGTMTDVPAGAADYVIDVRAHGDEFRPAAPVTAEQPALVHPDRQLTHEQLVAAARDRATVLGIAPDTRLLIDVAVHPEPLDWLLAPLVSGASTVLCGRLDPSLLSRRGDVERVSAVLAG